MKDGWSPLTGKWLSRGVWGLVGFLVLLGVTSSTHLPWDEGGFQALFGTAAVVAWIVYKDNP